MSDETKPYAIKNVTAKKVHVSQAELFGIFIGFSIVMSLWTSIGTQLMSRWKPASSGITTSIVIALVITVAFAWIMSKVGLNIMSFESVHSGGGGGGSHEAL